MPPRKRSTEPDPADAAIDEATRQPDTINVEFRGHTFELPASLPLDARFNIALASMNPSNIVFEALGAENASIFLSLVKRGETILDVSAEFMQALNKAAGWGNS